MEITGFLDVRDYNTGNHYVDVLCIPHASFFLFSLSFFFCGGFVVCLFVCGNKSSKEDVMKIDTLGFSVVNSC